MGPDPHQVQAMFTRVAPRYDRANAWLSAGVDRSWRRSLVEFADVRPGDRVLDVCTGTGDLAMALALAGADVVGADFCVAMLQRGQEKAKTYTSTHSSLNNGPTSGPRTIRPPRYLAADCLRLPFADHSFDLATVGFGIRNVENPVAGLAEMARVVRPGGRVVVLEFCKPTGRLFSPLYMFYFRRVLPRLGAWISGDRHGAYGYLSDSVMAFPEREKFLGLLAQAGLATPRQRILSLGIAALYRAEVRSA